ncbi:helix-turn-helix domain-containing protein [Micromonospora rubida]
MSRLMSPGEEAAYELIVDRPSATLATLAGSWSGGEPLPAVLARLAAAGLITVLPGPPERYVATAPEKIASTVLVEREVELDLAEEFAQRLATAYRKARAEAATADVVEVVTGHRAVRQRLAQVRRCARREIMCLETSPYLGPYGTGTTDNELLAVGVTSRCIYDQAAIEQTGVLPEIEQMVRAGQQARVLPNLPMKLYIADGRLAVLPLQRDSASSEAVIVVHASALLDALGKLFEGLWQRAVPLRLPTVKALPGPRRHAVSEERLIALLLSGITDEAIARHLGISYRTAQRHIAALMAGLGADTRFQAGVQAAFREQRSTGTPLDGPDDTDREFP